MIPKHGYISIGWPGKTYIHQLYADTGCCLEDLPSAMAHRDRCYYHALNNNNNDYNSLLEN